MTSAPASALRRTVVEFVGSAALTAVVVGSGIAATELTADVGLQLLINAIATVFGLFVLITVLGPTSGAHFNPVVTLVDVVSGQRGIRDLLPYLVAQVLGCVSGSILANVMFDRATVSISAHERITAGHLVAEVVATAGLVFVIFALARSGRGHLAAVVVATYIGAAYFFTSSTSFANPAITIGRIFSDSFAGIAPGSAPLFILAQLVGGAIGWALVCGLLSARQRDERMPASEASRMPDAPVQEDAR